jgi:hypothetical protein
MENINTELEYIESLKKVIRDTVEGICNKGVSSYPNICRYGKRSTLDIENIIEKILKYMTNESMPMRLDSAINLVDCELQSGFGE